MSRYLCTFPGKYGDLLWSLPTVRAISQIKGEPVDFAIMPQYKNILPLLQAQPYIDRAFVIEEWLILHSNHGDQPWLPQKNMEQACGYHQVWHLGYRGHPGLSGQPNMCLADFIAWQQGIRFVENPIPFIQGLDGVGVNWASRDEGGLTVALAFNEMYADLKLRFRKTFGELYKGVAISVMEYSWLEAAVLISKAGVFVGDRSALHVIAHGVGQKLITYEPHPARHKTGHLGTVFGCPYGKELAIPFGQSPERAAEGVVQAIQDLKAEENVYANDKA